MKRHGSVYLLTNTITGRQYVGQTVQNLAARWKQHQTDAGRHPHPISRAIAKHGWDAIEATEIYVAYSQEALNHAEEMLISAYGTAAPAGYNLRLKSAGKGAHHPDTILRLKAAARRRHAPRVGLPMPWMHTPEIKAKAKARRQEQAKAQRGVELPHLHTDAVRYKRTKAVRATSGIAVVGVSITTDAIIRFECLVDAGAAGFCAKYVSRASRLNGTYKGFTWTRAL